MNNEKMIQYHNWLRGRSWLGYLYRNLYLYPLINKRVRGKAIDIGCGIGDLVNFIDGAVGVDINKYNVEYCKSKDLPVTLSKETKILFNDAEFNCSILDNVIEHIHDSEAILKEAIRITKPGGKIIIGIPVLKYFFWDTDHKIYLSDQYMRENFLASSLIFKEFFLAPHHYLFRKIFKHTSRWYIYEVI